MVLTGPYTELQPAGLLLLPVLCVLREQQEEELAEAK